jgi:hypothetical protein
MSDWKPPKGYHLTRHDGHFVDDRGFRVDNPATHHRPLMPDGQEDVLHFFEDEPFKLTPNDGTGQHASVEARKAALAGKPIEGWNPNAIPLPIEGGWVPPTYTLTHEDDDTPEVRPAVVGPPSDQDQIAMLRAGIEAAQARIAEIEGGDA